MKIYVKPIFEIKTLEDVIKCLYRYPDGEPSGKANETFTDEECTEYECHRAFRSFEDILTLARTYFPDTTEEELMRTLVAVGVGQQHCSDIHKVTFFGSTASWNRICKANLQRRVGENKYYIDSTYTPKMLLDIYERAIPQQPKL